ncbi:hypothetical protein GIB67_006457 [Kingdonia uniflora]|uniref:Uncharacterized protein n=1 Tax=Kingdonia uniflora TaxID=39325 RepID=A0A7J7NEI3_9MAGN|nr:hypothetical protein GIB67_006457 [Kingdonia uniflora]
MDESSDVAVQGNQLDEIDTDGRTMEDFPLKRVLSVLEKPDTTEDVSNVSFIGENVVEILQPDLEYRDGIQTYQKFILQQKRIAVGGKNRRGKEKRERAIRASEKDNHSSEPLTDAGHPQDVFGITSKVVGPES